MIPSNIIQSGDYIPPQHIESALKERVEGWDYRFFTYEYIMNYFTELHKSNGGTISTDASGNVYTSTTDASGNVYTSTDASGNVSISTTDASGNVSTSTTDASGNDKPKDDDWICRTLCTAICKGNEVTAQSTSSSRVKLSEIVPLYEVFTFYHLYIIFCKFN
jgi:hypothetical protein